MGYGDRALNAARLMKPVVFWALYVYPAERSVTLMGTSVGPLQISLHPGNECRVGSRAAVLLCIQEVKGSNICLDTAVMAPDSCDFSSVQHKCWIN
jgi:hypothetical protein